MKPIPGRLAVLTALASSALTGCSGNLVKNHNVAADASSPKSKLLQTGKQRITGSGSRIVRTRPVVHRQQVNIHKRTLSASQTAAYEAGHSTGRRKAGFVSSRPTDHWRKIFHGFGLPSYTSNSKVRNQIRYFARNPESISIMAERSTDHLPYIVEQIERRGMPSEIALLPFVESAFKTAAYSHAKAAGLWQFIPSTGVRYGLTQNSRYDGRYDPHASTNAALDYLQDLHQEFNGDWLLALAAYNCGERRVAREIARNRARGKGTSFWELRLPRETRNYVPRLLAYKQILSHSHTYGVVLPDASARPAIVKARVNKPVDLERTALLAGLPEYALTSINRAHKTGITSPSASRAIYLPRSHAGKLLRIIDAGPATRPEYYYAAANRKPALRPASDHVDIEAASRLLLKTGSRSRVRLASLDNKHDLRQAEKHIPRVIKHRIKRGETLYRISKKYGVSINQIMRMNRLKSTNIKAGKHLRIAANKQTRTYI